MMAVLLDFLMVVMMGSYLKAAYLVDMLVDWRVVRKADLMDEQMVELMAGSLVQYVVVEKVVWMADLRVDTWVDTLVVCWVF